MSRCKLSLRLCSLFSLALCGLDTSTALGSAQENVRSFQVTASRFQFQPSRLEVNLGDRVRIILRSTDVDHGFGLPVFDVEANIPASGEPVAIEFTADKPGTFPFGCTTFCGDGHFGMVGELVVLSAETVGVDAVEANLVEPNFTLINLPTTRRLPRNRFAFRVTHRFRRPLSQGSPTNLFEDLFGLDGGAEIGLELRYGFSPRTQVGFYRTSDRTIELSGRHNLFEQGGSPIGVSIAVSMEGMNNFRSERSASVGVVVSRRFGGRAAVYLVPRWVSNTNLLELPGEHGGTNRLLDSSTLILGVGGRLLLFDMVALVGEISPRLAGFDESIFGGGEPDFSASFGIEKVFGGHVFQVNFSNHLGTTSAQLARGQQGPEDWFIGFNISRKFF